MISNVIGKRNRFGGWEIHPKSMKSADRKDLARRVAMGTESVTIRCKSPETNVLEGEAYLIAGDTQKQLKAQGFIRVTVERVHDRIERRYRSRYVEFKAGEEKQVTLGVACILLQQEPYCYLFEEVGTGSENSSHLPTMEDLLTKFNTLAAQQKRYEESLALIERLEAENNELKKKQTKKEG